MMDENRISTKCISIKRKETVALLTIKNSGLAKSRTTNITEQNSDKLQWTCTCTMLVCVQQSANKSNLLYYIFVSTLNLFSEFPS